MTETIESPLLTVCSSFQRSPSTSGVHFYLVVRLNSQVPFEALRRAAKDRKSSLDEVTAILQMLHAPNIASMSVSEQMEVLNKMAMRLQSLKRKVLSAWQTLC